jgi:hypothetical protein
MKFCTLLTVLFLVFNSFGQSFAQRNISGKKGFINIPDATSDSFKGDFTIGYVYNPMKYGLIKQGVWSEQVLYADLAITSRLNCTFLLLQGRLNGKRRIVEGLGDRQFDVRYQLLKEKKHQPSLAIIMSNPFSISAGFGTQALVIGKTLRISKTITTSFQAGYGSPYYIMRNERNLNNSDILSKFKLIKKSEDRYKSDYLTGVFGGIKFDVAQKGGILLEWDTHKLNAGAYVNLFKIITLQAAALNRNAFTCGVSYTHNLNSAKP